ncbi:MAG: VWA domain-containing protein [Polyangiaceae bacterium]
MVLGAWTRNAWLTGLGLSFVVALSACSKRSGSATTASAEPTKNAVKPEQPTVTVQLAYGSEKKTWLVDAIKRFNASQAHLPSNEVVRIEGMAVGSGAAVEDLVDGTTKAHAWAPASSMYRDALNRAWTKRQGAIGGAKELVLDGKSLALSPVVLAMWKPMAQALGWPAKPVGWADVLTLAKDPQGWGRIGHPEWGSFKFGHTHPAFSNSGTLSVLAEAYAGLGETRGLTAKLLETPKVERFMESIEQSVVHYGKSTGFFSDKMLARGPSFLSAAVSYENLVVDSYRRPEFQNRDLDLVCVYPKEGTFWIDNPFYVLDAPWSDAAHRQAAEMFRDFLLSNDEQRRVMSDFGFRPSDPKIALGAPIDAEHGANPKEPQTLLELPPSDVIDATLSTWEKVKKTVDILFVFDRSGSMAGEPLRSAKQGAIDFLQQLSPRDRVSMLTFNDRVPDASAPVVLSDGREGLVQGVSGIFADGGTALYDAVDKAHDTLSQLAKQDSKRIFAAVVLTDGRDEHSKLSLASLKQRLAPSGESAGPSVRVFTIAYGEGADPRVLSELAETSGGAAFKGDAASIRQVYRDLAAFF